MIRLNVVNPNTTASMTAKIAEVARKVAGIDTQIIAKQPEMGPVSIEGYYDEAFAVPGLLSCIRQAEAEGLDGHIIACFDDTGLEAARSIAKAPVVGIGEAAFHMACLVAPRFSVITTLALSITPIEHNLLRYGLASRCARVRAADVPVLALEEKGSYAVCAISQQIEAALKEDRAEAIVLGCAGMADLAEFLSQRYELPVIDGVGAAVILTQGMARLGIKTSKISSYRSSPPKAYLGSFSRYGLDTTA